MFVVNVNEMVKNDDVVRGDGFISIRPVVENHGMGFSVHKTLIPAGTKRRWHYKKHLESCYCISGFGIITDEGTGETYAIKPDVIYSLNENDPHIFEALTDVVLISIFNPPVSGHEVHNEDGSYD